MGYPPVHPLLSTQNTVDGQYIPSLFIEPEVRHDKTSYSTTRTHFFCYPTDLGPSGLMLAFHKAQKCTNNVSYEYLCFLTLWLVYRLVRISNIQTKQMKIVHLQTNHEHNSYLKKN